MIWENSSTGRPRCLNASSAVWYAHSLGPDGSAPLFEIPRHQIEVPQSVARKLRQAGFAESLQMNAEEDGEA